ncbi:phosphoheptose isomerase, partial [candidate division KSB1 bacterium]
MDYSEAISLHLKESAIVKEKTIHACLPQIQKVIDITAQALQNGHKILICGNGGSAADSQHIAAEFVIRLS